MLFGDAHHQPQVRLDDPLLVRVGSVDQVTKRFVLSPGGLGEVDGGKDADDLEFEVVVFAEDIAFLFGR